MVYKILQIVTFLFLVTADVTAQNPYTVKNLENASVQELNEYLLKADKLKKTGRNLVIIGSSLVVTDALLILTYRNDIFYHLFLLESVIITSISGLGFFIAGIPIRNTGINRIDKLNNIIQSKNSGSLDIQFGVRPKFQHSQANTSLYPCIALNVRF